MVCVEKKKKPVRSISLESLSVYILVFVGMDYADPKRKSNVVGKILLAATLTALCILMLKQSSNFTTPSPVTPLPNF